MKLTLPNQQELSYHESGRGKTVVLIHAFPLNRDLWTSTSRVLSTNYHVLAPDLIGFGGSSLSAPLEASIDLYGDHIVALLEEKKIKKAVLVGCSIGGYILLPLSHRYPTLFRGMVLVDTKAEADPPEVQKTRRQNADLVESSNPSDFYEGMLARLLGATSQRERPGVVASVRRMMSQASPHGVAAALRAMAARSDSSSTLSSIHTPTLVLTGEEDQITPPAEARVMASKIPNGSFVMIPKAGHLPSIEAPEAFQRELLSFLSTLK